MANEATEALHRDISRLLENRDFYEISNDVRIVRSPRGFRAPVSTRFSRFINDTGRRISVAEMLSITREAIEGGVLPDDDLFSNDPSARNGLEAAQRLKRIVPSQKIAPVQFDILDGILTVSPQVPAPKDGVESIALAAQEDLVKRGDRLIEELRNSNCDRRLLDQFEELQAQLVSPQNIIQLGLTNIGCGLLAKSYEAELPSAVSALLQAHTVGVSMFVGQFPDWVKFSENAAAAQFEKSDVSALVGTLSEVIKATESRPLIADQDVPKTLRYLQGLTRNPRDVSAKTGLAIARTLENLVISVFRFGAEIAEQTERKTADSLSTAAAKIATAALLGLALSTAVSLTPLADKFEGMGWIKDAIQIVRNQLDSMK
ncbi:hypothetical protein NKI20_04965 [Mesorhizobium sp. M0830]|uniref:hypothetical protein n=1 Tax=Mesorhizobium sp. M0830 TaxID=2957008 RepID=UPI003336C160